MFLYNRINKEILKKKIQEDNTPRITLSFYKYVNIEDPHFLRDEFYKKWSALNVLGRIYLAKEGINAQLSVPQFLLDNFKESLYSDERFTNVPFKIAVEDNGKSFYKLAIKVRNKIVADGLDDNAFDVSNVGKHLSAKEFNELMDKPGTIVVDMRNHYESEVGRFEGAICPDSDTFRDELPLVVDLLKEKKDQTVLLYCTGGIRCEKASAYLKHHGFTDVNQLHGGIIDYVRQIKAENIPSKFIGKNFVFDERLGERVTEDIISNCHQCGKPADTHVNCANFECHLLFIQCEECQKKWEVCCSEECLNTIKLPIELQRAKRKGPKKDDARNVYKKGRLRPNLGIINKLKLKV